MSRTEKYELIYIKLTWVFIISAFIYVILNNINEIFARYNYTTLFDDFVIITAGCMYNFNKVYFLKRGVFEKKHTWIVFRIIEFTVLSIAFQYVGDNYWIYLLLIFPLMITSLEKGSKTGIIMLTFFYVENILVTLLWHAFKITNSMSINSQNFIYDNLLKSTFFHMIVILFVFICGNIYNENFKTENENNDLIQKLEEKYQQLELAQDEIKFNYEKLKEINNKLENTNSRLIKNIAEFFTLQQISQAIGSIFDVNELLKYVNDIILGVMGTYSSTIILYDEEKRKFKMHTTNIKNAPELATMNDNVNCSALYDVLNSGKPIIENFVDPEEYRLTKCRDVNSLICVPLITKARKYGIVLVEHKHSNAFDEENMNLLNIIGQQVGIAMENAELYQKMQYLATTDGLTGLFNRLYFQQQLDKEFDKAKNERYPLSVVIFDIDHFKKFNDTFGHLFGDKVLKAIANIVKGSLRKTDVLARFGGEEFIILFPRTKVEEAYEKAEMLRRKISSTVIKDNLVTASVTVSFGVSSYPECAATEGELLRTADGALYDAKTSGRNCVKIAPSKE